MHPDLPHDAMVILESLLLGIREALPENLVGLYLRGSIVMGDFDPATSDLDFFTITERPISEAEFQALYNLHERLSALPNKYGHELEGPYIDRAAAKRFQPGERHPTIERGETLQKREQRPNWILERWVVREQGITLLGPDPTTLIAPISPEQLRSAVRATLTIWADWIVNPDDPDWLLPRAHQAYVVETMCRALYTLEHGDLATKPRAVAWALQTLPDPWRSLVEKSRAGRTDSAPNPDVVPQLRRFVHWVASTGTAE